MIRRLTPGLKPRLHITSSPATPSMWSRGFSPGGSVLLTVLVSLTISAQAPVRKSLPVPDLPGYRTLKGDFHLHTVFSDGNVWPTVHVMEAWRDGLDVIALTEHAEYHPHKDDVKVDANRSYATVKGLADQLGLILIRGIEITKPDPYTAPLVLPEGSQHFNALFVTDGNALNVPDLMEALRRAKGQGAFVFWNHPRYRVERAEWFAPVARAFDAGLFQGMELVNGPDIYTEAFPWIEEKSLTILANSDAHDPVPPASSGGANRPITLIFAKTADADGIREALVSRRTAAWMHDQIWGREEHLRGLWQGAVTNETPVVTRRPGASPAVRLRNTSAIPMDVRVRRAPDWFLLPGPVRIAAGATTLLRPAVRTAPPGNHSIDLELEVTNLHVGPGRELVVTLPLTVEVAP
jgi:3',5'-nucleoside bisphosphate phosphatase